LDYNTVSELLFQKYGTFAFDTEWSETEGIGKALEIFYTVCILSVKRPLHKPHKTNA
jgi:hypothetical protein